MTLPLEHPGEVRQKSGLEREKHSSIGGKGSAGCAPSRPFSAKVAIDYVGQQLEVSSNEIVGSCRQASIVRARHCAALTLRMCGLSLHETGKALNRDHTTILHAEKVAKRDPALLRVASDFAKESGDIFNSEFKVTQIELKAKVIKDEVRRIATAAANTKDPNKNAIVSVTVEAMGDKYICRFESEYDVRGCRWKWLDMEKVGIV